VNLIGDSTAYLCEQGSNHWQLPTNFSKEEDGKKEKQKTSPGRMGERFTKKLSFTN